MTAEQRYYTNTFIVVNLTLILYREELRKCAVIMFVDPDGKERIPALNPKHSQEHINMAKAQPINDPVIHLWAHGKANYMLLYENGTDKAKTTASQMESFLSKNSKVWQANRADGEDTFTVLVLHACETGKGESSFAEKLSNSDQFKNVLIIAPTENVIADYNGKYSSERVESASGKQGSWRFFFNGKQVDAMNGTTAPYFNDINKLQQKYDTTKEAKIEK